METPESRKPFLQRDIKSFNWKNILAAIAGFSILIVTCIFIGGAICSPPCPEGYHLIDDCFWEYDQWDRYGAVMINEVCDHYCVPDVY